MMDIRYSASLQVSLQQRPVLIQIVSPEGLRIEFDHIQDKTRGEEGKRGKVKGNQYHQCPQQVNS